VSGVCKGPRLGSSSSSAAAVSSPRAQLARRTPWARIVRVIGRDWRTTASQSSWVNHRFTTRPSSQANRAQGEVYAFVLDRTDMGARQTRGKDRLGESSMASTSDVHRARRWTRLANHRFTVVVDEPPFHHASVGVIELRRGRKPDEDRHGGCTSSSTSALGAHHEWQRTRLVNHSFAVSEGEPPLHLVFVVARDSRRGPAMSASVGTASGTRRPLRSEGNSNYAPSLVVDRLI
jgi:hypothetical protein